MYYKKSNILSFLELETLLFDAVVLLDKSTIYSDFIGKTVFLSNMAKMYWDSSYSGMSYVALLLGCIVLLLKYIINFDLLCKTISNVGDKDKMYF